MPLPQITIAYVVTAVVFLAMDAVWLGTMAERLYRPGIGHLMAPSFAVAPAVIFYVLYVAGMVFFAVAPAMGMRRPVLAALGLGAALGLLAYATFSLTNHAVLKGWPWQVTVADLAWGTLVTGVSAAVACAATPWLYGLFNRD